MLVLLAFPANSPQSYNGPIDGMWSSQGHTELHIDVSAHFSHHSSSPTHPFPKHLFSNLPMWSLATAATLVFGCLSQDPQALRSICCLGLPLRARTQPMSQNYFQRDPHEPAKITYLQWTY
jgi:hypothetical protein